jgi:hypothetical protein
MKPEPRRRIRWAAACALFMFTAVAPLGAATIAYQIPAGTVGNQDFFGPLGMDFDVLADVSVSRLGVFDSGSDGLGLPLTAELWSRNGNAGSLLPGGVLSFTPADPGVLVGGSRFKDLAAPILLTPGSYSIVAHGYGPAEFNGNSGGAGPFGTVDGGTNIVFSGSGRYGLSPGSFPNFPDGGPANRYGAGTFVYDAIGVPPPPPPCGSGPLPQAYVNRVGAVGTQNFGGPLGMDFVVNSPIAVSSLGVFDSEANGLFADLGAQLWLRTPSGGIPLAGAGFTTADPGTLVDSMRHRNMAAPLILAPGNYTISAYGYNDAEPNGNAGTGGPNPPQKCTNDGGGLLSFVGGGTYGLNGPGTYPDNADGGPADRYSAGTFAYQPAAATAGVDHVTQGTWIGKYGAGGYILPDFDGEVFDVTSLPAFVSGYQYNNAAHYQWNGAADDDPRAVQNPANPANRRASTAYSGGAFEVQIDVNQAVAFQLGLYLLDYDGQGSRIEEISFPGRNIPATVVESFQGGVWYLYDVTADPNNPLRISLANGSFVNSVLSAITIDDAVAVPEPSAFVLSMLAASVVGAAGWRRRKPS